MNLLQKLIKIITENYKNDTFTSQEIVDKFIDLHPEYIDLKINKGKDAEYALTQTRREVFGKLSRILNTSGNYIKEENELAILGFSLEKDDGLFTLVKIDSFEQIDEEEENESIEIEFNREQIILEQTKSLSKIDKFRLNTIKEVAKNINTIMGWKGKTHQLSLEVDHAKSIKEGGLHHPDNLQLLTQRHNAVKNSNSEERLCISKQIQYINKVVNIESSFLPDSEYLLLAVDVEINKLIKVY